MAASADVRDRWYQADTRPWALGSRAVGTVPLGLASSVSRLTAPLSRHPWLCSSLHELSGGSPPLQVSRSRKPKICVPYALAMVHKQGDSRNKLARKAICRPIVLLPKLINSCLPEVFFEIHFRAADSSLHCAAMHNGKIWLGGCTELAGFECGQARQLEQLVYSRSRTIKNFYPKGTVLADVLHRDMNKVRSGRLLDLPRKLLTPQARRRTKPDLPCQAKKELKSKTQTTIRQCSK